MKLLKGVLTSLAVTALCGTFAVSSTAQESSSQKPQSKNEKKIVLAKATDTEVRKQGEKNTGNGEETRPRTTGEIGEERAEVSDYRIGIEDVLQVSVWAEPGLSQQVLVRPDGMITLPLVNDVYVVGLTPLELRDQLTEKLQPFVNNPQVTVIVRTINSRKVFLLGNVARQGAFQLVGRKTVLELITEAGGLGVFAKRGSIYILREQRNGESLRIPFDYKKVLAGRQPDVELQPGDMVVVP